jgi:hypothetical protein
MHRTRMRAQLVHCATGNTVHCVAVAVQLGSAAGCSRAASTQCVLPLLGSVCWVPIGFFILGPWDYISAFSLPLCPPWRERLVIAAAVGEPI